MNDKNFFLFNARNGASYIINSHSWDEIKRSLGFYNARFLKQKIFKVSFCILVYLLSKFQSFFYRKSFLSSSEVQAYIKSIGCLHDFDLNYSCSLLVSPTRDKVIINYHGSHFKKIAFGKSYLKVAKEAEIYKLLMGNTDSKRFFSFSSLYDYSESNGCCSFKMSYPQEKNIVKTNNSDLLLPLVEFFKSSEIKLSSLSSILYTIKEEIDSQNFSAICNDQGICKASVRQQLFYIVDKCMMLDERYIPLGLVHGDFKPWNIINTQPLTIFDFEEANIQGLPLVDYLNYIVDPIIRYKEPDDVVSVLFGGDNISNFRLYLSEVDCNIDYTVFIYLYLLGRVVFWYNQHEHSVALCYFRLLNFIDLSRYKLNV